MENRKERREEAIELGTVKGQSQETKMRRNQTAQAKNFSMIARADIPRSRFYMPQTRKQAFNASELIPIMCEEVLPGDTWQHTESIMARLATPIAPAVDDIDLETWYFAVPCRILWDDWEDFITGVNTEVTIPLVNPIEPGVDANVVVNGVFDHFGILPGTYGSGALRLNVLPIWAYFTIYNEWFRDQNLQEEWVWSDTWTYSASNAITQGGNGWNQLCLRVNKRHDYFTSSLPWPQKGNPVEISFGTNAPVVTSSTPTVTGTQEVMTWATAAGGKPGTSELIQAIATTGATHLDTGTPSGQGIGLYPDNLYVDLSAAATTINAIRLAFQTQKMLERDARGGSRYVENLLAHWGVRSPDYRLQRPEYLGGSKIPITVNPIAQTAAYDAEPADAASAVGNLGAEMHASGHKRTFTYAATEHCYIIGVAAVRATPTYQQGTRRLWRRSTRLDFPLPVFGHLGEQAVATQEIFQPANNTPSNATWGYQERYAEMRYIPNEITGVLRSTVAQPLDWWHYSEEFPSEPALNAAFITDKTQETLARSLATAPSAQWSAQIIMDIRHDNTVARLLPTYGTPGLIDHF